MKKRDKERANAQQINRFFNSYSHEWRLIHLLAIEKLLINKYDFYKGVVPRLKDNVDEHLRDSIIGQEVRYGLIFEAVQNCLQYTEDLFALIRASENKDYFIKNIITYDAGRVQQLIKHPKLTPEELCAQFHFPYFPDNDDTEGYNSDVRGVMKDSLGRLSKMLREVTEFYKAGKFFYNQYKHGLTVALRPFRDNLSEEEIQNDKLGKSINPVIVALDNLNFENAPKNQYGNGGHIMMPVFTDEIRPHLNSFQKENNLLRFVVSPPQITIEKAVRTGQLILHCMEILIPNFLQWVNDNSPLKLRLPSEIEGHVYEFEFETSTI